MEDVLTLAHARIPICKFRYVLHYFLYVLKDNSGEKKEVYSKKKHGIRIYLTLCLHLPLRLSLETLDMI